MARNTGWQLARRSAALEDAPLRAKMNRRLVEDEKHPNRSRSDARLEERMRGFLAGACRAVLFDIGDECVAHALYTVHRERSDTTRLRRIFVERSRRRRGDADPAGGDLGGGPADHGRRAERQCGYDRLFPCEWLSAVRAGDGNSGPGRGSGGVVICGGLLLPGRKKKGEENSNHKRRKRNSILLERWRRTVVR